MKKNKNKSPELTALMKASTLALADSVEASLAPFKEYLTKFTPESLQDEETREEFLFAMAFYQDKMNFVSSIRKMVEEHDKEEKKEADEGQSFGFLKDPMKEAA